MCNTVDATLLACLKEFLNVDILFEFIHSLQERYSCLLYLQSFFSPKSCSLTAVAQNNSVQLVM